jgi:hypothetical protein
MSNRILVGDTFAIEPYEHGWIVLEKRMSHAREPGKRGGAFLYEEDGVTPIRTEKWVGCGFYSNIKNVAATVVELVARDGVRSAAGSLDRLVEIVELATHNLAESVRSCAGGGK